MDIWGGSSPFTRGKRARRSGGRTRWRLIPAHAGKTSCPCRAASHPPAHPRSRGENFETRSAPYFETGSSPLTRGKRFPGWELATMVGLIPAYTGKTCAKERRAHPLAAHPLPRGENHSFREGNTRTQGSSPLTRGKRIKHLLEAVPRGLIPTHTGKTS